VGTFDGSFRPSFDTFPMRRPYNNLNRLCDKTSWRPGPGFVLNPQGFAVVGFAYGFAGFAYGLEVSQSRETSTAAAAAIQVSAADSHTFAEKYHNRPSESSQAYLRTIARLQC